MHRQHPEAAKSELERCHQIRSTADIGASGTGVFQAKYKGEEKGAFADNARNGRCRGHCEAA
jgi:hypothetical protein